MSKSERPKGKSIFLFIVDLLILSAFTAAGVLLVPALAGPRLPPRATVFIVIGCFVAGLALCLFMNRLLRKNPENFSGSREFRGEASSEKGSQERKGE